MRKVHQKLRHVRTTARFIGYVLLVVTFLLWSRPLHAQVDRLDLTSVPLEDPNEPGVVGGPVGGLVTIVGDAPKHGPELAVRLVSVFPSACHWQAGLIYEVELTNISPGPVVIPWAEDRSRGVPAKQGGTSGYLRLIIDEPSGALFGVGVSLRGSDRVAGTLKTLSPKQSVRIRAREDCRIIGGTQAGPLVRRGESRTLAVHANAMIHSPLYGDGALSIVNEPMTISLTVTR